MTELAKLAKPAKPTTIHVNLTSRCNLRCRICRESYQVPDDEDLPHAVLEGLYRDAFPGLKQLRLDSAGELLLSRELPGVVKEATRQGVPIFVSSNGTCLSEARAELLCGSTLEHIQISLDSPDPATLEWIRRGSRFDRVVRGARNLVEARRRRGSKLPKIDFHAALLAQNIDQLPDLVRFASEVGIDGVSANYGFVHGIMEVDWAVFWDRQRSNRAIERAREVAGELGVFFNPPPLFDGPLSIGTNRYCQYLFEWSYVQPNGKVYPCCIGAGGYECGDLRRSSFDEIWYGDAYQELRRTYSTPRPAYYKCASCYISAGYDPNDYRSHFAPCHWPAVEERLALAPGEPRPGDCTYGPFRFPAALAREVTVAVTARQLGEHERARQLIAGVVAANPEHPDLHCLLAEITLEAGDRGAARGVLQHVLGRWPRQKQAQTQLARLALQEGRYRESLSRIKAVLSLNPEDAAARACVLELRDRIEAVASQTGLA